MQTKPVRSAVTEGRFWSLVASFGKLRQQRADEQLKQRATILKSDRNGAAVIELAVLLPLLTLLFVIAVDVGRIFYFSLTIQNCARAGAIYAADPHVAHESPFSSVQEAALADASNLSPAPAVSTGVDVDAAGQSYVKVTVTHKFSSISSFPGIPHEIDLERSVRMYVAENKPDVQ
jgi:Flp pilus assembly protein TadG